MGWIAKGNIEKEAEFAANLIGLTKQMGVKKVDINTPEYRKPSVSSREIKEISESIENTIKFFGAEAQTSAQPERQSKNKFLNEEKDSTPEVEFASFISSFKEMSKEKKADTIKMLVDLI